MQDINVCLEGMYPLVQLFKKHRDAEVTSKKHTIDEWLEEDWCFCFYSMFFIALPISKNDTFFYLYSFCIYFIFSPSYWSMF